MELEKTNQALIPAVANLEKKVLAKIAEQMNNTGLSNREVCQKIPLDRTTYRRIFDPTCERKQPATLALLLLMGRKLGWSYRWPGITIVFQKSFSSVPLETVEQNLIAAIKAHSEAEMVQASVADILGLDHGVWNRTIKWDSTRRQNMPLPLFLNFCYHFGFSYKADFLTIEVNKGFERPTEPEG